MTHRLAGLAGTATDREIAEATGLHICTVSAYRRRNGIPCHRYPPERVKPDPKALLRWLAEQWEPVTTATVAERLGVGEERARIRLLEAGAMRVGRWPSLWVAP